MTTSGAQSTTPTPQPGAVAGGTGATATGGTAAAASGSNAPSPASGATTTAAGNTGSVPAPPAQSWLTRFARRPGVVTAIVVIVAVVLAAPVLFSWSFAAPLAFASVVLGGTLGIIKEVQPAIAQDPSYSADQKKKAVDRGILCSIYAAVFGFPAIASAAAQVLFK